MHLPAGEHPIADGPQPLERGTHLEAGVPDQDAGSPDGQLACATHCDCPQGAFCYLGKCLVDPKLPAYCCSNKGCPPGRWCVNADGSKALCPEDPTYTCADACDCGPAHCCIGGVCVRDAADPWAPPVAPASPSCKQGQDPTYCCSAPECQAGRLAYGAAAETAFRCYSRDRKVAEAQCGGSHCFGTACRCAPGVGCLDMTPLDPATQKYPPAGKACWLLAGGSCVSHAAALALFNVKSTDLLPCCTDGCSPQDLCDAGAARRGGVWAYQRVVANCTSCGNGTCDEGEWPSTCPKDCKCGDGKCAPEEVGGCPQDCGWPGNGVCDPGESPRVDKTDCVESCGDGWCTGAETEASCPADCVCPDAPLYPPQYRVCGDGKCGSAPCDPETCLTCPKECGDCAWTREDSGLEAMRGTAANLTGIWAGAPNEIYIVGGQGTIMHFDGTRWTHKISRSERGLMAISGSSGTAIAVGDEIVLRTLAGEWLPVAGAPNTILRGTWAGSASNVFVVGDSGQVYHYDGASWSSLYTLLPSTGLNAVWGAATGEVFAVGNSGIVVSRTKNGAWAVDKPATNNLYAVWGSSATDVFAVGATEALRFNGLKWQPITVPIVSPLTALRGVAGAGGAVFAVGDNGVFAKYDAAKAAFQSLPSPVFTSSLYAVHAFSPTDVLAVGIGGLMLRYDGVAVKRVEPRGSHDLTALSGSSAVDIYAAGSLGTIVHYDGSSWSDQLSRTADYDLYGIWSAPATAFFVGGYHAGVTPPGIIWQVLSATESSSAKLLRGVSGSSASDLWAVGLGGSVIHDDGTGWKSPASLPPTSMPLTAVWGSSTDLFVVGFGSTVLHYDGKTWTPMSSPLPADLLGVWGSSPTDVFAVGAGGAILHYAGSGTWTGFAWPAKPVLFGVWGSSPSDVLAVGEQSTILQFDGKAWARAPADIRSAGSSNYACPTFYAAWGSGGATALVAGQEGTIIRRSP